MLIGSDRLFDPKLADSRIQVAVAARSRRWSIRTIAEAFGINARTVRTLRDSRHGRYKAVGRHLATMSEQEAMSAYIDDETIERLDATARQLKLFGPAE
jgi:Homeodomain-like domain